LRSIVLRYFNAAGATADGELGEDKEPATHLIPLVFKTVLGKQKEVVVHGYDYPTPDGTGIRDYVHVVDLAEAHILALRALLEDKQGFRVYNVGTGKGSSVKEVIEMVRKVTGKDFPVRVGPRRPGDWATAYADVGKIQKELGWQPQYRLKGVVETDWKWFSTHPNGFTSR
jgi:UDP-glucose 4-epimerase